MKPGIPWSVKGIEPEVREAAKYAARRSGMTLGEWLNSVILDQADDNGPLQPPVETIPRKDFSSDFRRSAEPAARPRLDDTVVRLEDIAQQLSRIARREQESATIRPYEAPSKQEDSETLRRILARVDTNERQAVEAFTSVNERLAVLGSQVATATQHKPIEKPEDVPGFTALEQAIRNVVGHLETSEQQNRNTLKSMQDRLGEMTQRATHAGNDEVLRAAPALVSLETRLGELAARVERTEQVNKSALPELVRVELQGLADRIETVREAAETLATQAQSAAVSTAQHELHEIETRIQTLLSEAQTAFGNQPANAGLQQLRAEIGSLNQRIDDVKIATASDRDVDALRVAVEQLSTRMAQGADPRPLADLDRRLGEITDRLEHIHTVNQNQPQLSDLERRIAELDHRLGEAVRLEGDGNAVAALEQQISAVNDRLGRAEQQLTHFDTIERAITQLFESLEQNRNVAREMAEETATRVAGRFLAAQAQSFGLSAEMQALQEGLRAVRESAANSDQRSQETLEAVHETLEQIVNKLAELETASAGYQLAVNMGQHSAEAAQAASAWQPLQPLSQPEEQAPVPPLPVSPSADAGTEHERIEPTLNPSTGMSADSIAGAERELASAQPPEFTDEGLENLSPGDDFIAAARRAANAAAGKTTMLNSEIRPALKRASGRRFKMSLPFRRGGKKKSQPEPVNQSVAKPMPEIKPAISDNKKRRKLLIIGLTLLVAVTSITIQAIRRSSAPPKQTTLIETTVQPVIGSQAPGAQIKIHDKQAVALPEPTGDGSGLSVAEPVPAKTSASANDTIMTDGILTGALPAKKTDASLAAIVAQPGATSETVETPPAEIGSASLREAAVLGNATAQFIVASRYLDGQNVPQDFPKAAYWYQQAAARGLVPAQYRIATLFERGKGVPQDIATALLWYERAAAAGNVKSMHNAAVIAAGNQVGTSNYDKAFKWFTAAATRGLKDSQFNLAVLYERGLGTRIDKAEALFWYLQAVKQGDADAGARADELAKTLNADVVKSVKDKVTAWVPAPAVDDANVVTVANQDWNAPGNATAALASAGAAGSADPVMTAQKLLKKLGFDVGEPNGKMGSRTVNAIRIFQLQLGLPVTGEITPDLLSAMQAKSG